MGERKDENTLDILDGCKISSLSNTADLRDRQKYAKLDVTEEQQLGLDALVREFPTLMAMDILEQNALVLTFPEGIEGSLMKLKRGGYSTVMQGKDGKIVGVASLEFRDNTMELLCLNAFTMMSVASGQYFLSKINERLVQISAGLDRILEFLYGDKRAELLSEVSFIRFAHENYGSIMAHKEQRIATLISLQSAKKVAMKDIEFYLSDLSGIMHDKKSGDISATVPKMVQAKECLDLSLQLYTMSSLLEVYYAQNYDKNYISFVKAETSGYIAKCEKRELSSFGALRQLVAGTKDGIFNLNKTDKSDYSKQIDGIMAELEQSDRSALQKTLQSALDGIGRKKEYCIDKEGAVYLKLA